MQTDSFIIAIWSESFGLPSINHTSAVFDKAREGTFPVNKYAE